MSNHIPGNDNKVPSNDKTVPMQQFRVVTILNAVWIPSGCDVFLSDDAGFLSTCRQVGRILDMIDPSAPKCACLGRPGRGYRNTVGRLGG